MRTLLPVVIPGRNFDGEPILRVTAPLREAQLNENRVINLLHLRELNCRSWPSRACVTISFERPKSAQAIPGLSPLVCAPLPLPA